MGSLYFLWPNRSQRRNMPVLLYPAGDVPAVLEVNTSGLVTELRKALRGAEPRN